MTAALRLAMDYDAPEPARGEGVDPVKFAPIGEVADKLGLSRSLIQRRCRDKWAPAGLAFQAVPPEGGSPMWYVSRRADPRLMPVLGDEYQVPDLSAFTISQQREAHQRAACVAEYRTLRETSTEPQSQWLPALVNRLRQRYPELKLSERSLRRWYTVYQRPAQLINLISARGGDQLRGASPESWKFFISIYCDERRPTVRTCWKRTRDEAKFKGWKWTSYEQCRRQLNDRISPDTQLQFRNPRAWRWKHEPYLQQDPDAHAAGCCYVGDHSQLDLICLFGDKLVRPWVTTWMDWRTRKITGWTLSISPDSTTIMAALRMAMMDPDNHGGPDLVWIDNGRDYDSYVFHGQTKQMRKQRITEQVHVDEAQFQGVLGMLGIKAHFSLPYRPNGKSRQERWYGTLHDQFDKTFITYTGKDTVDKPESLARVLKQRRNVPTFEEVRDRLGDFIKGYNADADHSRQDMKGLSPDEALEQWCPRKRVMADDNVLCLLMQHWAQPVSVGRNGVRIAPLGKGFNYGQFDPALRAYKGTKKKVLVAYDPHDIRRVRVFDIEGRYITTATMNELGGMSTSDPIGRKQVGELIANQRRYRKSRRDVATNGHYAYLSDAELLAKMQIDKPAQPERERPMKIVRTPLDDQSKYVEHDQFRQAAGAELEKPRPRFEYKRDAGLTSPVDFFRSPIFYQRPTEPEDDTDILDILRSYTGDRFADDDGSGDGESESRKPKGGDN